MELELPPWLIGEGMFGESLVGSLGLRQVEAGVRSAVFPTRVVSLGANTAAYTFTMFQQPGVPDTLFEAQRASLEREFAHIRSHFIAG